MTTTLALLGIGGGAIAAPTAHAAANCTSDGTTVTCTFGFTGAADTFIVPAGVDTLHIVARGAAGASGFSPFVAAPGLGGEVVADRIVTAGDVVTVTVGGRPTALASCNTNCVGGFNGGGSSVPENTRSSGGGGGGATDVRIGGTGLSNRVLVAGGGGGGGAYVRCNVARARGGKGGAAGAPGSVGTSCEIVFAGGDGGGAGSETEGGAGGEPAGLPGSLGIGGDYTAPATSDGREGGGGGGGGGYFGGGSGGGTRYLSGATSAPGGGGGGSNHPGPGTVTSLPAAVIITYAQPVSPTVAVIPAVSANADPGECTATVGEPAVTITGTPAATVAFSPALPASFPVGSTEVTATASNGVAPDASTTFSVTVVDDQPPTFDPVTTPVVIEATGPTGALVSYAAPVASDNCPGVTITRTDGPASETTFPFGDTVVTHTATDASGIVASTSFTVTVRDTSPPTIVASVAPAPNLAGWNRGPVTVTYTCADVGSGVESCSAPQTLTSQGINPYSGSAVDVAGNQSTVGGTTMIDDVAPTVTIAGPTNGGHYTALNVPAVSCVTTDATSGVATPATLGVGNGANNTVAATCNGATDVAGNTAAPVSITYKVAPIADLAVSVSAPVDVARKSTFTATVTVANRGPSPVSAALLGVRVGDRVGVVSAPGGRNLGGIVTYTVPALASGAATTFTITLMARHDDRITIVAGAVAAVPDPDLSNNTALSRTAVSR